MQERNILSAVVRCLLFDFLIPYTGLYGSRPTSWCISHGPCQWERAIFDPSQLPEPQLILIKLEIYNYLLDTTPYARFQGLC